MHEPVQRTVLGRAWAVAGRSDPAGVRGACARREGATRFHAPAGCGWRAERRDPGVSRGSSVRRFLELTRCDMTSHLAGNDLLRGGGDPHGRDRARGYDRAPALELRRRHQAHSRERAITPRRCPTSSASACAPHSDDGTCLSITRIDQVGCAANRSPGRPAWRRPAAAAGRARRIARGSDANSRGHGALGCVCV